MATAIITGVTTTGQAATGYGAQNHLVWAPNQNAWWIFYADTEATFSYLTGKYSTDGTTWTVPTGFPFDYNPANGQDLLDGRNSGFFCKGISGIDVLHQVLNLSAETFYLRFTLGTTVANTHIADSSLTARNPGGSTVLVSSGDYRFDAVATLRGDMFARQFPNVDSGSSWTAGTATTLGSYTTEPWYIHATAVASLGSDHVLFCWGDGTGATTNTDVLWSVWNGSTFSTPSGVFGSFTATEGQNWTLCEVTTSDIHIFALTNNVSTITHKRFNGTSWAAGNTIPSLTMAASGSLAAVSDGTNVWLWSIDSSGNVSYCKWNGTAWDSSWTVQEATRSNTPSFVTVGINAGHTAIQIAWNETNGSNSEIWTSQLSLTAAPPTTATLSGPTSGALDVKSTAFTVTLDQPAGVGGIIVTPSSTGASDTFSSS